VTCDEVRDLTPAYVLGALEGRDEEAVRDHLATCLFDHSDVTELGSVVAYLADAVELVEPPEGLKARILAAATADLEARQPDVAAPASATQRTDAVSGPPAGSYVPPTVTAFPSAAEREARVGRRATAMSWATRIAAVFLIAVLAGWNLLLQNQVGQYRDYDTAVAAVIRATGQPGAQAAILHAAAPNGPEGVAALAADGTLTLAMRNLPATAGTDVYEAWVIVPGDPAPKPAGSFQVGQSGTGALSGRGPAVSGATIALTREKGPGATAPTLPILSVGTATPPPAS
jgi:hypothetical protein